MPDSNDSAGPDRINRRVLGLFEGIGGITRGLEAHGGELVAYSEVDPYACQVLALRYPNAVNLGDITTIDWEVVNRDHGPIDIISGGFPCQDISTAGLGAGIAEGTRSGLWSCYADAIRHLRPRGVLVENVAALLARGIDRVLGDLAACGYDAEWDCIPAAAVGAPHLRDRVFIVAYRTDLGAADSDPAGEHGRARREGRAPALDEVREDAGTAGADADGPRRFRREALSGGSAAGARPPERIEEPVGPGRSPAPDTDELGAQVPHRRRFAAVEQPRRESSAGGPWPTPGGADWWRAEPDVGRVAHGVPKRMDRLRCLGNAVVPQVAEHVAGILIDRMEAA